MHILMAMGKVNRKLENKAYRTIKEVDRLEKSALNGLDQETRHELYDFIVGQLESLEASAAYDIRPIRIALQKQKPDLLGFSIRLDDDLGALRWRINRPLV